MYGKCTAFVSAITATSRQVGCPQPDRRRPDACALAGLDDAADELTPVDIIDPQDIEAQRLRFSGSVPSPNSVKGLVKTGLAKIEGEEPTVLMGKLGKRLAFKRTGTRLHDALIVKYKTALDACPDPLTPFAKTTDPAPEAPGFALVRIRAEELAHVKLLAEAIRQLGNDPAPFRRRHEVASMGIMQMLNHPRITLAQCLNAMLIVELTDNAGWELLVRLADDASEKELARQFTNTLIEEPRHIDIIRTWLTNLGLRCGPAQRERRRH